MNINFQQPVSAKPCFVWFHSLPQIRPCQFHVFYPLKVQLFNIFLRHVHLCACSRGSRWWWRSSWPRHTLTSTSPSCTLAGSTLQVTSTCWELTASKDLDKFDIIDLHKPPNTLVLSLSVCPSGGQRHARLPQLHEGQSADPGAGGRHRCLAGCLRGCNQKPQWTFLPGFVASNQHLLISFTSSHLQLIGVCVIKFWWIRQEYSFSTPRLQKIWRKEKTVSWVMCLSVVGQYSVCVWERTWPGSIAAGVGCFGARYCQRAQCLYDR